MTVTDDANGTAAPGDDPEPEALPNAAEPNAAEPNAAEPNAATPEVATAGPLAADALMPGPIAARPERSRTGRVVPKGRACVAGVVGAAVSLGVGELLAGLFDRTPSLLVAVGDLVIDRAPSDVVRFGIDTFGRSDKPALLWGIVALSLAIGGAAGLASRTARTRWVGPACFAAFGLFGAWAAARFPQARTGTAVASALVAAALGALTLRLLARRAGPAGQPVPTIEPIPTGQPATAGRRALPIASPLDPPASRRSFLAWAGAGTAFAGAAALGGRQLQQRSAVEAARAAVRLPSPDLAQVAAGGELDGAVAGISPYLTPTDDFYLIDTALLRPRINPATWRLGVKGMVGKPFELSYDDLLGMEMVERTVTLSCVSNEVGGSLVGNARWQGVPLANILARAEVDPAATQLVGRSVDGWTAGMPTAVVGDGRTALIAVAMNGEPLPLAHGFPARLVVAGLYGYVSATKWLKELELTRLEDFDGYWIPRGWSKDGPVKTQSRIDVPRSGAKVAEGTVALAGVAWAPNRGIAAVEVRIDEGPWQAAQLGGSVSTDTWVQWVLPWEARKGRHVVSVRASDRLGDTQTDAEHEPPPDGATGHHRITVEVI